MQEPCWSTAERVAAALPGWGPPPGDIASQRFSSPWPHPFGLLAFVGGRMLWESLHGGDDDEVTARDPTSGWSLVMLSAATSVDALAVGLSLVLIGGTIIVPAVVIGFVAGVKIVAEHLNTWPQSPSTTYHEPCAPSP